MKSIRLSLILVCSLMSTAFGWISCQNRIPSTTTMGLRDRASPSQLRLKFLERSDDGPSLQLSPDEDDAIRAAAKVLSTDDAFGVGWFDRSEAWIQAKQDFPILADYDDSDLRDAYLKQKPKLLEVFTDTPLGPFVLINLLAKFSGFTWCDTPFGQADACPPL
eukprot:scaffold618_cov130-Cylindrotheca_fusiformis.AAC.26